MPHYVIADTRGRPAPDPSPLDPPRAWWAREKFVEMLAEVLAGLRTLR